jgi:large repetitive protein
LSTGSNEGNDFDSGYGDYYSRGVTDENGKYIIKNLGEGKFKLTAGKDGYASSSQIVEKEEDQTLEVNFKLESPAVIKGKISTEDNEPIEWVSLSYVDGKGQQSPFTQLSVSSYGEYEYKRLSDGDYEIIIAAQGYAPQSKKVTVTSGKEQTLDFKLVKGNKLLFNVKDTDGNPVDGTTISFSPKNTIFAGYLNTRSYSGSENSEYKPGTVTIENLPSHRYEIKVTGAGYKVKAITVDISDKDAELEVVLEKE